MDAKSTVALDHRNSRAFLGENADRNAKSQQTFQPIHIFLVGFRMVVTVSDIKRVLSQSSFQAAA